MTSKGKTKTRRNDWAAVEDDFMQSPGYSVREIAERWEIPYDTVETHARATNHNWTQRRKELWRKRQEENNQRLSDILSQSSADDVAAFRAMEFRLQKVVLSGLEMLFPPADAPQEAHTAARNRMNEMSARQISSLISEGMRTLTETGRHRRLLLGQSTAIYERALPPGEDLYLVNSLEEAQALEMQSRRAQIALRQFADPNSLDVDFAVMPVLEESAPVSPLPVDSPEIACPSSVSPNSPIPPTSHNAQDTGVRLACVTSKEQADELGGL